VRASASTGEIYNFFGVKIHTPPIIIIASEALHRRNLRPAALPQAALAPYSSFTEGLPLR
jgi:hypothetical protein